jgi:hypothetical protein
MHAGERAGAAGSGREREQSGRADGGRGRSATPHGKVLVHHPHAGGAVGGGGGGGGGGESPGGGWEPMQGDVSMLSLHRPVAALCAAALGKRGKVNPRSHASPAWEAAAGTQAAHSSQDVLVAGTPSDLTAYDVARNADVFFRDLPDGVLALAAGPLPGRKAPVVFAGGACSVVGVGADGGDVFWAVTGAQVLALALVAGLDEGQPALVTGLDSGRVRVYAAAGELLAELALSEPVVALHALGERLFAFALAGGTVGVYHGLKLLWRTKAKTDPVAVLGVKMAPTDTMAHVAVAWADGSLEVYQPATGHALFRDVFPAALAGLALVRAGRRARLALLYFPLPPPGRPSLVVYI